MNHYDYAKVNLTKLAAWVAANGINPGDVPMDARVRVEGDTIVCPVHLRNDRGFKFIDEETRQAARGVVRVPLVAEPGETVARWLALAAVSEEER